MKRMDCKDVAMRKGDRVMVEAVVCFDSDNAEETLFLETKTTRTLLVSRTELVGFMQCVINFGDAVIDEDGHALGDVLWFDDKWVIAAASDGPPAIRPRDAVTPVRIAGVKS